MSSGGVPGVAGEPGCCATHRAAERLAPSGFHPSPKKSF